MWVAQHESGCSDQSRYTVTRERIGIEDAQGNIVDADPTDGEVVHSECAECHAKAHWKTK